jgi:hypothetical protein
MDFNLGQREYAIYTPKPAPGKKKIKLVDLIGTLNLL